MSMKQLRRQIILANSFSLGIFIAGFMFPPKTAASTCNEGSIGNCTELVLIQDGCTYGGCEGCSVLNCCYYVLYACTARNLAVTSSRGGFSCDPINQVGI
jgi:hypothetical protein